MKKIMGGKIDLTKPEFSAKYMISLFIIGVALIFVFSLVKVGSTKLTDLAKTKIPMKDNSINAAKEALRLP